MTRKTIKLIFISVIAVILIFTVGAGYAFLKKNTSFVNFKSNKDKIKENNFSNNTAESNPEISFPTEQELIVHDNFKKGVFAKQKKLILPKEFSISVFTSGLKSPRSFDFDSDNNLYITDISVGKLIFVNYQKPTELVEVDKGLKSPHGIDLFKNDLYVAEEHQVVVYRGINNGKYNSKETLIKNVPQGGGHVTRTIHIGPDEKIYLTIGSSCNVCEEKDNRRAAMLRYNLDGTNGEIFAEGLRNTVGFTFTNIQDDKFDIISVDNGRDRIGDNLPPEEVNIIEKGKHYGWPFCYGNKIPNPEFATSKSFCDNSTTKPLYEMHAHIAPLGIEVFPVEERKVESKFPDSLRNNLFISQHGSWNSTTPVGYRVVRFDRNSENPQEINFITGWLEENGDVWGRPVEVKFDNKGDLFISDDKAGAIYKISYILK